MEGIILGMPGKWASSNYEVADIYTTKIGGLPDWPFSFASETPDLLQCITCRNKLSLLAQVYAPLPSRSSEIERIIYVFCCLFADCQSLSWRALRIQKISSSDATNEPPSSPSIPNSDCKDDRWKGDTIEDEDDMDMDQLLMTFSEAANISPTGKRENNDVASSKKHRPNGLPVRTVDETPVVPCFYIYSLKEKLMKQVSLETYKHALPSLQESKSNSEDPSDGETYEENYEYDRALNADRKYLKFKKRLDVYQEQCFRYSYGGKPLLASSDMGDPGICNLCGGSRHYEMQLMPPVIYFLQEASDEGQRTSLEKFDWMTLLVYTCSKSCTDSTYHGNFGSGGWMVAQESIIAQCELYLY